MEIKNIIIVSENGSFDFNAEGIEPEVIGVFEDSIEYMNPVTGQPEIHHCDFSADAAIIVL